VQQLRQLGDVGYAGSGRASSACGSDRLNHCCKK
jgi:hypothetical protein